jgi:adenylate kinase family enzyme
MDRLNWQPGWVESSKAELHERLALIVTQDEWLIDGNYGGTLPLRLERADTVIYLDFPITLCLRRIVSRIWQWRGRSRPDMTEGCPERLDWAFLFYVAQWRSGPGPRTEARLAGHEHKVIRLRSPAALQRWMDSLPPSA